MSADRVNLSIIIPTYNDEETIEEMLHEVFRELKKTSLSYEVVVCNDSSTDSTLHILNTLQKQYKELTIFTHEQNKGYGETIKDLYLKAQGEWMMSLPGDYQFEPSSIHTLLPFRDKADMIIGKRIDRHDTPKRLMQSKTYNRLLKFLFNIPTTDTNSIRLMKKKIIENISFKTNSAFVDAELVILAHRKKFSIVEVPITHRFRETGEATGGKFFKTILPTFVEMIKYRIRY